MIFLVFLCNLWYNIFIKNEKGVEAATPTPPIKTKQNFA
ncbi:thiamine biosynthesis protein ThiS [Streptococcus anginosus]|nr:thiamine biosynthesis protein ThiS [Streptococcus anginosus]